MMLARPRSAVEVAPEVHAVDGDFDGVPLTVYLLGDPRGELALVDAGVSTTPERDVLPAIAELGARPEQITRLVITHAHHDHAGGSAALRALAGDLSIAVHRADAGWVQSAERYLAELYECPRPGLPAPAPEFLARVRRLMGEGTPVDRPLEHADVVAAGGGRLAVTSVPAHTPGHVILRDGERDAVFVGDALQGRGFEIAGRPRLFPSYGDVAAYRASVRAIAATTERHVCTAHFGVLDRSGCTALARESLAFADDLDALLRAERARRDGELSVGAGIEAALAAWPHYERGVQCHITVRAHLDALGLSDPS